jgi:ribonuclease BN (tRNA processing enzyme)
MTIKLTTVGWWGAYPDSDAATSSFLLQADGRNILIDCGSGVLCHLQRYLPLEALDAVVVSHYHWDHVADIGCLQYAARIQMDLGKRRRPLQIYGHGQDAQFSRLTYLEYCRGIAYDPDRILEFGRIRFSFCPTVHPDPCFAIRAEIDGRVLVYITDTGWRDELVGFARAADLLICESSLYDEYRGAVPGHLSAGEAGSLAARAGAKHLVLTHLPHFGEHERLLDQAGNKFRGNAELAASGKCWLI